MKILTQKNISAIIILGLLLAIPTQAVSLAERLQGKILLQVENNGEAWYINPTNKQRYFMGRPDDAFNLMRGLGVGITNSDIEKIPIALANYLGTDTDGDGLSNDFEAAIGSSKTNPDTDGDSFNDLQELQNGYSPLGSGVFPIDMGFANNVKGKIFLQVQRNGEAWYINPENSKRYFLGRPADAFEIMRNLGLGITNTDLQSIPISTTYQKLSNPAADVTIIDTSSSYKEYSIATQKGDFDIKVVTLNSADYRMITDTANINDCTNDCPAMPLEKYVQLNGGTIGIHGSYFCPPDYSQCVNEINSYLSPVFNSNINIFLNSYKLRFHDGPIITQGASGKYYYYHRTRDFGIPSEFAARENDTLQAGISNWPALVENYTVVSESETVGSSLRTEKRPRGAIGYNNSQVFLVIAPAATVIDMGYIMKSLGAQYAMNLDGGGTSALYYNGSYKSGPNREIPTAIIFKKK